MVKLVMESPSIRSQDTRFTICKPTHALIAMYDITKRRSFAEAKKLVDEFAQRAGRNAFVALVGNKADLESRREVSFEVSNVAMFI